MKRVHGAAAGAVLVACVGVNGSAQTAVAGGSTREAAASASAPVSFSDVTNTAGVGTRSNLPGGLASGSAWRDFDGDGRPDLFVGNHYDTPVLFKNVGGGKFTNATSKVMVRPNNVPGKYWGDQHGAAWGDVDENGKPDLLVLVGAQEGKGGAPNQLYLNIGGKLVNHAKDYGIEYRESRGRTPLWIDYNNDGHLDMFQGAKKRDDGLGPPTMFRGTGTKFTDVRDQVNFRPTQTVGGWASDINRDGRLELLYQGDRLSAPAAPFKTRVNIIDTRGATFRDATPRSFRGSLSDLAVADYDRDLRPDIFFCNSWLSASHPYGHDLYLNKAGGMVRVSGTALADINKNHRSCRPSAIAADFDNDMDVDIFADAGHGGALNRGGGDLPNFILWNRGNGTFEADGSAGGATGRLTGWPDSASAADYDGDGFIDIYLTYSQALSQLYRNRGNSNSWLEINLRGTRSNRDGIGAQVYVTAGGVTQLREQNGGMHRYWSQDDQRLHFGLGSNRTASQVTVKWPSGKVQKLSNVTGNRVIQVTEP
ncbi:MAG: CRTAC1 family protein [Tetrasphaera sp.]